MLPGSHCSTSPRHSRGIFCISPESQCYTWGGGHANMVCVLSPHICSNSAVYPQGSHTRGPVRSSCTFDDNAFSLMRALYATGDTFHSVERLSGPACNFRPWTACAERYAPLTFNCRLPLSRCANGAAFLVFSKISTFAVVCPSTKCIQIPGSGWFSNFSGSEY